MPTTLLAPTMFQIPATVTTASFQTIQDITYASGTQAFALQPNQLQVGQTLQLRASGVFSTTATPNLTVGFYYGGSGGVTLAATAATACPNNSSNLPWILEWEGTVQSIGASGTIVGEGVCFLGLTATTWTIIPVPNATPQTPLTISTVVGKSLGVAGTWSASSSSNTISVQTFRVCLFT